MTIASPQASVASAASVRVRAKPSPQSPLQTLKTEYETTLSFLPDDAPVIDYILALLTAACHPDLTEPLWGYIVAAPGGGKTTSVEPFEGHDSAVFMSSPTENALLSGYVTDTGEDPSLIKTLDGKVLIIKDLTTIIEQDRRKASKILADFRDAYDGFCSKATGTAGLRSYRARFGVIACVTEYIDAFAEMHQQLGERFLTFRMNRFSQSLPDRIARSRHIRSTMRNKRVWKTHLRELAHKTLDSIITACAKATHPDVPSETEELVLLLANLLSLFRTVPIGGVAVEPEVSSRITQQLFNLGAAHCIADNRTVWDETDIALVRRVVLDTLSVDRRRLLMSLYGTNGHAPFPLSAEHLARVARVGIPAHTNNVLSQYLHSHIIQEVSIADHTHYRLIPEIRSYIEKSGLFSMGGHLPTPTLPRDPASTTQFIPSLLPAGIEQEPQP